jgi:hypothetical protein
MNIPINCKGLTYYYGGEEEEGPPDVGSTVEGPRGRRNLDHRSPFES